MTSQRHRTLTIGTCAVSDNQACNASKWFPDAGVAYPDLHLKAAALLQSLARNHALVDGNKRLAWTASGLDEVAERLCSWSDQEG